jgi:hypothetical protein
MLNEKNSFCEDCVKDDKVFCKRDPDVKCLICGAMVCGGHIIAHLSQPTHCVSTVLDYCIVKKPAKGE